MKAIFKKITFTKPVNTKKGERYQFKVLYEVDGEEKTGSFLAEVEDQQIFKEGVENEFQEQVKEYQGNTYYNLWPVKKGGNSNYARNMAKEQARYSGFAMSYAKDLVVAGKIPFEEMFEHAEKMHAWMVTKDKELQNAK